MPGPLATIGHYWHTLRYLRPIQFWGRLTFKLYHPRPDLSPTPGLRPSSQRWSACARTPTLIGAQQFRLLNHEASVGVPGDWNRDDCSLLWRYHLHYFDDLAADGADTRAAWHRPLIDRWIEDNPPTSEPGWAPYPTSLRIVNWIKSHLSRSLLDEHALHSLAVQTRWLQRRIEVHLLGNHLWANAKALLFSGCFFAGAEADKWFSLGLRLFKRELDEQILADGGHFERSPMYHAIVLEDLLDVIQLSQCYPGRFVIEDVERWRTLVSRMLIWLRAMTHPDGTIAFFNDATGGQAPRLSQLERYAAELGLAVPSQQSEGAIELRASGYIAATQGPANMMSDVGEIGPSYLPGHAHADTLSFELSVFGHRFIVNTGIDQYGTGEERLRQRGTAAHSTVIVDGENSSEVWSGFRVARRAHPLDLDLTIREGGCALACSHDGYRRLKGRVTHRREWDLSDHALIVSDYIEGAHTSAVAHYHLHPQVTVKPDASAGKLNATLPGGHQIQIQVLTGTFELLASSYHPEFGISQATSCMAVAAQSGRIVVQIDFL